jgi:hypothetical protein
MNQILKFVCFVTLIASVSVPVQALQLDVVGRTDNSLDEQPPLVEGDTVTLKMNLQDCTEMTEILVDFSILTDVNDNTSNGLFFFIGNSCNEDVADCEQVLEEYAGTTTTVRVSFWDLFEDVTTLIFGIEGNEDDLESLCTDATTTTGTYPLWAALLSDRNDETSGTWAPAVSTEIDIDPPDAPIDISATIGDRKAKVSWNKDDIDGYSGAYVLDTVTTSAGGGGDAGAVSDGGTFICSGPLVEGEEWDRDDYTIGSTKVSQADVTSATVAPLINGATYQFSVVSYDDFLNTSALSEVVCGEPWATCGFYCDYSSSGGTGGGSYCFVATAAFGSYDHPAVKILREFRDEFLAPLPGGKALISAYYSVGPVMAQVVGDSPVLRSGTRAALTVFAGFAWMLTAFGPTGTGLGFCVLFAFVMGLSFSRRRRR